MRLCSSRALANGRVTIMNRAMIAPEMRPNVQTVFFIGRRVGDGAILPSRAESRVTRSGDFRQRAQKSSLRATRRLGGFLDGAGRVGVSRAEGRHGAGRRVVFVSPDA